MEAVGCGPHKEGAETNTDRRRCVRAGELNGSDVSSVGVAASEEVAADPQAGGSCGDVEHVHFLAPERFARMGCARRSVSEVEYLRSPGA